MKERTKKIAIIMLVLSMVAVTTATAIHFSSARVVYKEIATKTNLKGIYYPCADRNWATSHALPEWVPPFIVGYSNYTIPSNANVVTWMCKDVIGIYSYIIPQSSIAGNTWINITMMYEPTGDGYMYTYETDNTGSTAMPGSGGSRWAPTNVFYEEGLSYLLIA